MSSLQPEFYLGKTFVDGIIKGAIKLSDNTLILNTSEFYEEHLTKYRAAVLRVDHDLISHPETNKLGSVLGSLISEYKIHANPSRLTDDRSNVIAAKEMIAWIDFFLAKGAPIGDHLTFFAISYHSWCLDERVVRYLISKGERIYDSTIRQAIQSQGPVKGITQEFEQYLLGAYFSQSLDSEELMRWVDWLCGGHHHITTFNQHHKTIFSALLKYNSYLACVTTIHEELTLPEVVARRNIDAWRFLVLECGYQPSVGIRKTLGYRTWIETITVSIISIS